MYFCDTSEDGKQAFTHIDTLKLAASAMNHKRIRRSNPAQQEASSRCKIGFVQTKLGSAIKSECYVQKISEI